MYHNQFWLCFGTGMPLLLSMYYPTCFHHFYELISNYECYKSWDFTLKYVSPYYPEQECVVRRQSTAMDWGHHPQNKCCITELWFWSTLLPLSCLCFRAMCCKYNVVHSPLLLNSYCWVYDLPLLSLHHKTCLLQLPILHSGSCISAILKLHFR